MNVSGSMNVIASGIGIESESAGSQVEVWAVQLLVAASAGERVWRVEVRNGRGLTSLWLKMLVHPTRPVAGDRSTLH